MDAQAQDRAHRYVSVIFIHVLILMGSSLTLSMSTAISLRHRIGNSNKFVSTVESNEGLSCFAFGSSNYRSNT
jgi:hypothetical protein